MVIYVGTKSKQFINLEIVFSTHKEILADKLNMKQEGSPTIVCNASQGKNKHSGNHSKTPHWCVPLTSLPWERITSNGIPYVALLIIKGLWQDTWKMKILIDAIYLSLFLPPCFKNRKRRAHFCSAPAVILSLVITVVATYSPDVLN